MSKQLNVNLSFTADTSKASAEIKALQSTINNLMKTNIGDSQSLGLTKEIKDANVALAQLKTTLNSATTAAGTLDLTKFNESLKASGMSLEQYRIKLSALGPEGSQAFSQLASSIASAEIPLKRANTLVTEFGTTLANTARWQLSSSLLHGFIGGLQHAYGYAQDLNRSLNDIRIVTGQSSDQMAQFAQKANQAAKELSTRTTDYTNASLIYYQQGLDDKAVDERTRTTLKLANVSRQSAEEVSTQMTAIWNNFDDGTKKLEYFADVITALGAKTASSSSEIAQGLSKFASIADTVGLSYETASAAIATVVAETRQSADTVGNAFKSIFARLQSLKLGETLEDGVGLTKYSEALEKVGVKILDINGELRDADSIMQDLGQRWTEISDTQKTALAQTVAGQRQYAQFVALFDNWDKVQENIGIASGSEGTLQEQADVYAESWEAAEKRVQASAEAIYDALISDKFFIGLNDVFSGFLNRINDVIQGLGGLKGVLISIGGLITQVFQASISNKINQAIKDFKATSKKGIEEARQLQVNTIQQLRADASAVTGRDISAETRKANLNAQADLQQTLLDNQKKYNEEQLETAQHLLDQNTSLREQAQLTADAAKKEEEKANTEKRRFLRDFDNQDVTDEQGQVHTTNIEKYVNQLEICASKQDAVANSADVLTAILNGTFDSPEKKAEAFTEEIDKIYGTVQQLGSVPGLETFRDSVIKAMDAFKMDPSEANLDKLIQSLRALGEQASIVSGDIEKSLVEELKGLPNAADRVSQLADSFKTAGQSATEAGNKTRDMANQADAAVGALKKMGSSGLNAGQMLTGISSVAMSFSSVITTITSAIDTLNNKDLTFGEKMLKIIPSLVITSTMLLKTLTGMGGAALVAAAKHTPLIGAYIGEQAAAAGATATTLSLGAAIKVALPLLAGIAAAIAGTVALIGTIVKSIDESFESQAEKTERLQKEAEDAKKSFENVKTAAEDLKTSFDEYDSLKTTLSECTEGTDEWYNALDKVNNKVLDIIEKFPELAKYMTVGSNGELSLDENGMSEFLAKQNRNVLISQSTQMQSDLSLKQNDADIEKSELAQKYEDFLYDNQQILNAAWDKIESNSERFGEDLDGLTEKLANGEITLDDIFKGLGDRDEAMRRSISNQTQGNLDKEIYAKKNDGTYENSVDDLIQTLANAGYGTFDEIKNIVEQDANELDTSFAEITAAQKHYEGTLNSLSNTSEGYAKILGTLTAQQDESLKDNPYFEQISNASGKVFESLYEQISTELTDTYKNGTEDLDKAFSTLINDNDIQGFKADTDGIMKRVDETSGELIEVSDGFKIAMLASAEAANETTDSLKKVAQDFDRLESSSSKADKGISDFLQGKGISRGGSELSKITSRSEANEALGGALGNQDGKISSKEAARYGYDSVKEMLDAFLEGVEQYQVDVEKAKDLGNEQLNKIYEGLTNIDELDLDQIETVKELFIKSLNTGGVNAFEALGEVFKNAGKNIEDVVNILSDTNIDWATVSVEELSDKIKNLSTQTPGASEAIEAVINTFKQLSEIDLNTASESYKALQDVISDVKSNGVIDQEGFDILSSLGDQVNDYFIPMADGTHKLIGDAESFYDFVNNASLEPFKIGLSQALQTIQNVQNIRSNMMQQATGGEYTPDELADQQIELLKLLNLEEQEQRDLNGLEKTRIDNKSLEKDQWETLQKIIENHKDEFGNINELMEEAQEKAENYKQAIVSSAKSLNQLENILKGLKDDSGNPLMSDDEIQKWKDFWKENIFDPKNIQNIEQFREALKENLLDTSEKIQEAWKNMDLSGITKKEFDEAKKGLDSSIFLDAVKELVDSGKMTVEEGQAEIIEAVEKGKISVEEALPLYHEITGIDDETTEETIRRINEEIKNGLSNADQYSQLLQAIASRERFTPEEKLQGNKNVRKQAVADENLKKEEKEDIIDSSVKADLSTIQDMGKPVEETLGLVEQLKKEYIDTLEAINSTPAPSVLKDLNGSMIDLIANNKEWDLDTKLEKIGELVNNSNGLISDETKKSIEDLVNNSDMGTEEQIIKIKELLGDDYVFQNTSKYIDEVLNNDSDNTLNKLSEVLKVAQELNDLQQSSDSVGQFLSDNVNSVDEAGQAIGMMNRTVSNAYGEADQVLTDNGISKDDITQDVLAGGGTIDPAIIQEYLDKVGQAKEQQDLAAESLQKWGDNLSSLDYSSLEEYLETADMLRENDVEISDEDEANQIIKYAENIDLCKNAVNEYYQALSEGRDTSEALFDAQLLAVAHDQAQAFELEDERIGELVQSYDELAEEGNNVYSSYKENAASTRDYIRAIVDCATRNERFNRGLSDVIKNGDDYKETVDSIKKAMSQYGKSASDVLKNDTQLSNSFKTLRKTVADLANTNEDAFSDNTIIKHFDEIKDKIDQGGDALNDFGDYMRDLSTDDLAEQFNIADSEVEKFKNRMSELQEGDLVLDANTQPFIESLIQAELAAGKSSEEIESVLQGLQIDGIDITPFTGSLEEAKAAAAAAGGTFVESLGVDVQAENMTVQSDDTKQLASFNEGLEIHTDSREIKYQEDANAKPITDEVTYAWATKTVTPDVQEETETKENTVTGVIASNGNKTAGSKPSVTNSRGSGGGGGGGGGCFIAGTLVTTKTGFKNIEAIQEGDIVLSFNEKYNRNQYSTVLETMIHVVHEEIYTLYIEDEKIITTGIHRFLITRNNIRGWIQASDLRVGDYVQFADGTLHLIAKIDIKVDLRVVYNFEVDGNHNYYVGKNQILAHNKGGRRGRGGSGRRERTPTFSVARHHSAPERSTIETIQNQETDRTKELTDAMEDLNREESRNSKLRDLLYGDDKIAYLNSEIKLIQRKIQLQKQYVAELKKTLDLLIKEASTSSKQKSVDKYEKTLDKIADAEEKLKEAREKGDKAAVKKWESTIKQLQKEQKDLQKVLKDLDTYTREDGQTSYIDINIKAFTGKDFIRDEKGYITNFEEIRTAAEDAYEKQLKTINKLEEKYASKSKEWQESAAGKKLRRTIDNKLKVLEATIKQLKEYLNTIEESQTTVQEEEYKIQDYEDDIAVDNYEIQQEQERQAEEAAEKAREAAEEALQKLKESIEREFERIVYSIDLKIRLKDDKLKIIDFLMQKIGDKAEKAATKIGLMGQKLEQMSKKSGIYEEGVSRLLDFRMTGIGTQTAGLLNPEGYTGGPIGAQSFPNGNPIDGMSGSDIVEGLKKGDRNVIEGLKSKKAWYKEDVEQMSQWINDQLQNAMDMREIKDEAIQSIGEVFSEVQEQMDSTINKHSKLQDKLSHYYNMIDLVGRQIYGVNQKIADRMARDQVILAKNNLELAKQQMKTSQDMLDKAEKTRAEAQRQYQNALSQGNQTAAEEWKHNLDIYDDQLKEMREKQADLVSAYWAAEEAAAEAAMTRYEKRVNESIKAFSQAVAKGFDDFDQLQSAFDRYKNTHSTYVEDYEKAYRLSKLTRTIEQDISKIDNLKSKEAYLKLQDEINKKAQDGVKLSQYDLQLLEKKRDLLQAQAAFEEAQNNKTQVSLTRDNEGNYGYVYTANEEDVAKAEQTYADKLYEMRKLNADYINELQSSLMQLNQNMLNDIQKLKDTLGENNANYQAELQRIKDDYAQQEADLVQQMTQAFGDSNEINTEYAQEYAQLTGDRLAMEVDYVNTWKDTVMGQLLDGYNSLADYQKSWTDNTKLLFDDVQMASRDWQLDNKEILNIAEDDFKEYVQSMNDQGSILTENSRQIVDAFKQQTDIIKDLFMSTINSIEDLMAAWSSAIAQMMADAAQLAASFQEVQAAWGELQSSTDYADTGGGDDYSSSSSSSSTPQQQQVTQPTQGIDDGAASRPVQTGGGVRKPKVKNVAKSLAYQMTHKNGRTGWSTNKRTFIRQMTRAGYSRAQAKRAWRQARTYKKNGTRVKKKTARKYNTRNVGKRVGKKIKSYATGGYTGKWGGQGKLAVLHEKELVLNQADTKNLLKTMELMKEVTKQQQLKAQLQTPRKNIFDGTWEESQDGLTRTKRYKRSHWEDEQANKKWSLMQKKLQTQQLSDLIDTEAMSRRYADLSRDINYPVTNEENNNNQQQININADFPNATNKEEIRAAFENMIGLASQYANRKACYI